MANQGRWDRRGFLRSAGTTALLGAAGAGGVAAAEVDALVKRRGISPSRTDFDFDEVLHRVGTDCIKWDRAIRDYGAHIQVGMGIADMDFRAAPCITQALAERCRHENWGYYHQPDDYGELIADWNRRRYGLDIDPASLVYTTGVHPAIIAAIQTFAPPGSRVLLNTPTYEGFYYDLRFTKTIPEDSPMKVVDGVYSIDWDDFEMRARRSHVFILCNPQNPTGNCWSPEDLLRMGEICLEHRVPVLADEIHCDFITRGHTYTPFASLPDRAVVDNSLTFKSSSKSFNLAAMKIAWFFSTNPDFLERVTVNARADLPTLGMVANQAVLTQGEPWLDELLIYLDANHDFAEAYVRDNFSHVSFRKPQGTFLAWLDVSALAERIGAVETAARESATSVDPVTPELVVQRWFAENAGVFLNPGSNYGTGGEGRMRMNLATSRKTLELALKNMAGALAHA